MRRREIITPDITPLIDVVFILLIFFIVSSVFKKEELALVLDLPTSSAKKIQEDKKLVIIELNDEKLAIYGKEVDLISLDEKISKIENKTQNIIFRIDKEVKYEKVVQILDILQKNELFNISLVTQKYDNKN